MCNTIEFSELPFELNPQQVIFVENKFNKGINKYIVNHYDDICKTFKDSGLEFCYIPKLQENLSQEEFIKYFAPYQKNCNNTADKSYSFNLLDWMVRQENRENIEPALLFDCKKYNGKEHLLGFVFIKDYVRQSHLFSYQIKKSIDSMIWDIKCMQSRNSIHYHIAFGDIPEDADGKFDFETKQLIDEIKQKVDLLHQKGINSYIIERLIHQDEILSDLHITKDNRIILTDYDNMEIKMFPLPKAVFFLFLKHPEGILFKNLSDYREELEEIYKRIKGNIKQEDIKSIEDITNPLNNSINEKCARIREAFLSRFDERLAKYYYVTGKRGEAKKILLPQKVIFWD